MWKHIVFPWKYFYKHSSEQLSRQVVWDIVMYTPEAKELKEKQCSCSQVFTFSYYVEVGGMWEQLVFPRNTSTSPQCEPVYDNRISAEMPSMVRRE